MNILYNKLSDDAKALVDCLEIIQSRKCETVEEALALVDVEIMYVNDDLAAAEDAETVDQLLDMKNRLDYVKRTFQNFFE